MSHAKKLLDGTTPGPWVVAQDPDLTLHAVVAASHDVVATIGTTGPQDARLIAAAPDLAARVVALEAEVKRLRGAQWKPIETAPKDGTVVFVWHVTRANPYACFDSNVKKARYLPDLDEWQVESVGGNLPPLVTHWMPLPAAPKEGKSNG